MYTMQTVILFWTNLFQKHLLTANISNQQFGVNQRKMSKNAFGFGADISNIFNYSQQSFIHSENQSKGSKQIHTTCLNENSIALCYFC